MTRLSKTQLAILRRMVNGDVAEYIAPPIDQFVWRKGFWPSPRKSSMAILERLGLVRFESEAWWGQGWSITEAGRQTLLKDNIVHLTIAMGGSGLS